MTRDETLESLIHGMKQRLAHNKEVMSYGASLELEGFLGDIRDHISFLNGNINRLVRENNELENTLTQLRKIIDEKGNQCTTSS